MLFLVAFLAVRVGWAGGRSQVSLTRVDGTSVEKVTAGRELEADKGHFSVGVASKPLPPLDLDMNARARALGTRNLLDEPKGARLRLLSQFVTADARATFIINACSALPDGHRGHPGCEERGPATPDAMPILEKALQFECHFPSHKGFSTSRKAIVRTPFDIVDGVSCEGNYVVQCSLPERIRAQFAETGAVALRLTQSEAGGGFASRNLTLFSSARRTRIANKDTDSGRQRRLRLGMCTAFTSGVNSIEGLFSWLAFHRLVGFDHAFVYVWGGREDPAHAEFVRRVRVWERMGFVTVIPFVQNTYGCLFCMQDDGHNLDCLYRAKGNFDWLSNNHIDEFLRPRPRAGSIRALLEEQPSRVDAVSLYEYAWSLEDFSYKDYMNEANYTLHVVAAGSARRPSVPYTRLDLGPAQTLYAYSQPFQDVVRPSRFDWRDQLLATRTRRSVPNAWAGDGMVDNSIDYRGENTACVYKYLNPDTEASLEHFSAKLFANDKRYVSGDEPIVEIQPWNNDGTLRGVVPRPGEFEFDPGRAPEVAGPLADVAFQTEKAFGMRFIDCVARVIDSEGVVPEECRF